MTVSRETSEPRPEPETEPAEAAALFGSGIDQARAFARALAAEGDSPITDPLTSVVSEQRKPPLKLHVA